LGPTRQEKKLLSPIHCDCGHRKTIVHRRRQWRNKKKEKKKTKKSEKTLIKTPCWVDNGIVLIGCWRKANFGVEGGKSARVTRKEKGDKGHKKPKTQKKIWATGKGSRGGKCPYRKYRWGGIWS